MGTRGCRGVSRDCDDVRSVRESRTITLKVRRRASAGHSRVQGGESGLLRRCSVRESRTITLRSRGRSSVMGGEVTIPDAFCLPLFWRLRSEPRRRRKRIFSFHISNIEPSASCVANSGLGREKLFLKGARHRRRLCPVEPHIQQRLL